MQNLDQPIRSQGNLKLYATFKERTLIGRNPVRIYKKRGKEWIKKKSKVSTDKCLCGPS